MISDDSDVETQNEKRIFRSPHFDDAWASRGALIKIYIDSIIPKDRYKAVVNIGIDVIVHNKSINIAADDDSREKWEKILGDIALGFYLRSKFDFDLQTDTRTKIIMEKKKAKAFRLFVKWFDAFWE